MVRTVVKIIMVSIVLMGSPNVLGNAATFNELSSRVDLTRTDAATPSYGNTMKTVVPQPNNISDVFSLLREGAFREASAPGVITRVAANERVQTLHSTANVVRSEPNLKAMLILGFGIVLISMVRRLGRI
jgi:hypothetical protein